MDGPRELVALHRPDQDVATGEQRREARVGGKPHVEVATQRHQHDRAALAVARRIAQLLQKRRSLVLTLAGREQLLKLVNGHHKSYARRERRQNGRKLLAAERTRQPEAWMFARTHDQLAPAGARRQRPRTQRRQDTGTQQR